MRMLSLCVTLLAGLSLGAAENMVGFQTQNEGFFAVPAKGEVKIDGKSYVIEAGNYAQSGDWWYLCAPYSETSKYMKNGKVVTK